MIKDDYGSANGNNQHQDQDYSYNNNYNNYADDEYIDIREDEDTVSYDTNYDSGKIFKNIGRKILGSLSMSAVY